MIIGLRAALAAASLTGAAVISGCVATQPASPRQDLCAPGAITADVASELRRLGEYETTIRYLSDTCPEAALALSDIPTESISGGFPDGSSDAGGGFGKR